MKEFGCDFRIFDLKSKTCPERSRRIKNRKLAGILAVTLTFVFGGVEGQAQQPKKIPRIGYISAGTPSSQSPYTEALRQGLRDLGYIDGQNIAIEYRYAQEKLERLPALIAELVSLKVDVIVTAGALSTRSAKEATNTIPIVMGQDPDPVGNGFVSSLSRPGGNITGLSSLVAEIGGNGLSF